MKKAPRNRGPVPMNCTNPMDRTNPTAAALSELAAAAHRCADQCGPSNRDQLWRRAADALGDLLGQAAAEMEAEAGPEA